jgi:hypothetical protein
MNEDANLVVIVGIVGVVALGSLALLLGGILEWKRLHIRGRR